MGGFSGWGGATDYLNEALERKKREEEEARQRAASAALLLRLARDKVSKPPVGVAAPQPQAQPQQRPSVADLMSRPQVDTGAPPISYSAPINNTVESDIEPQVQRRLPNSPIVQPRPNLPGINQRRPGYDEVVPDRLRGAYDQPNRPLVPQEPSPWQSPSSFNAPQQEYRPLPDEQWPDTGQRRQQVLAQQPNPIQNRVGDYVQDRYNDVVNWWQQSPGGQYLDASIQQRDEYKPPTIDQAVGNIAGNIANSSNPLQAAGQVAALPVTGGLATIDALQGKVPGLREVIKGGANVLSGINELGMQAANEPWLQGFSPSEIINADLSAGVAGVQRALEYGNINWSGMGMAGRTSLHDESILDYMSQVRDQYLTNSKQTRQEINSRVAEGQTFANLALRNLPSGQDAVENTLNTLVHRPEEAARLYAQAFELQESDPVRAGQLYLQAQNLLEMSNVDVVDQNMNPIAEFVYGMIFDPTNFVGPLVEGLGLTREAIALRNAKKVTNLTPGEAAARLTGALKQGERLEKALVQGTGEAQKLYKDIIAPFQSVGERITSVPVVGWLGDRTTESKAALDSDQLWRGLTNIFSGITNKEDAKIVWSTLFTEPGKLVQGINNLSAEAMQRLAQSDGMARWGAGVANDDFLRRFPLLKSAQEQIFNLDSLKGVGNFNPKEYFAELSGVIYDTARRANGGKVPTSLPFGAKTVDLVRVGNNSAAVVYLDSKGQVIKRGIETSITQAQRTVNGINNALEAAGKKNVLDWAKMPSNIQRAIMSDVWLGFRPANWIGNALGATTSLFGNDAYTLTPLSHIDDYFGKVLGGVSPNMRLEETLNPAFNVGGGPKQEIGGGAIDWLGRTLTRGNEDNPLSRLSRFMYDIPYGSTEIPLPGGAKIPVGEGAFYGRAYYVPFKRTRNAGIAEKINNELLPTLQQIEGMTPEMIHKVGGWVQSLAENGGKSEIAQGIRQRVGAPTLTNTLRDLGVPPELLSPQAARQIEQWIMDAAPSEADRVMKQISGIIAKERNPAASVLNLSPGQPGIYNWTDHDIANEAAWMADSLARDASKAGQDMATAAQEGVKLATDYLKGQQEVFSRVLQDVAAANNNPDTWSVAMDFWHDVQHAKSNARKVVDQLGSRAVSLGTPEAWADKWNGTKNIYGGMPARLAELGDQTRLGLQKVLSGGEYAPRHDWYEAIQGYLEWDEEAFRAARTTELGSPNAAEMEAWQKMINANRSYVDNSVYDLFGAFQKHPSVENFDIVRHGMNKMETLGAQVAYNVGTLRDQLASGQISKQAYAQARNLAWNNYFDAMVEQNSQLGKAIIRNGILKDAGVDLKWTDSGATYQLARPSETPNKFWARNLSTGKEEEFTAAQTATEFTPFTVPQSVIADYKKLIGDDKALDAATEQVLQEIADSAPPTLRPAAVQPEIVPAGETTWAEPATESSLPGYNGADLRRTEPLPEEIPSTAQADRAAYYDQEIGQWVEGQRTKPAPVEQTTDFPPEAAPLPEVPPVSTAPTPADIRRAATEAGIATATNTGAPTDRHLLASLKKRANIRAASLDDLTDSERVAAMEALGARKVEKAAAAQAIDLPEGYTLKQADRFAVKGQWAVHDENGNLVGNYRKTQGEAVQEYNNLRAAGDEAQRGKDAYSNAIAQLKSGDVNENALKTISNGRTYITRQTATDALTSMGLSNKEAKSVIANAGLYGETGGGAMLYSPDDIVRRGLKKLEGASPVLDKKLTKPQLIEQYGDQLRQQGLTDQQISRMSKAEVVKAIGDNPIRDAALPEGVRIAQARDMQEVRVSLNAERNYAQWQDSVTKAREWGAQQGRTTSNVVMSITSGRWDDVVKDIERGTISAQDATAIERELVNRGVISQSVYDIHAKRYESVRPSTVGTGNAPAFGQGRTTAASTPSMFAETGEDLPLVSGAAPRPQDKGPFKPAVVGGQESMFDTRPTMGGKGPTYQPKVTTVGDVAKVEGAAALDTQRTLSKEWNRVAVGEFGLPPIDTLIARFKRNGAINLSLDKGEVKLFEDLYGNTIAGMPINNLDDVEHFLQQYNNFGQQVKGSKATVAKSKTFAKMSGAEIVKSVADELRAAGLDDAEIAELATQPRRTILDTVESIRGETPDQPGMVAYDFQVPSIHQLLGMETPEAVAGNSIRDWINRSRRTGGNTAPQMADVAEHQIRSLNDLERTLKRKLPEILAGAPNELTGAQRLRVVDTVLDWMPHVDDVTARAQRVGEQMAGWMMLNFNDRRNFDSIIQLMGVPYHYFWSRMPSRVAMAALQKPELVNLYYEAKRAIALENKQSGVPERLEGTLPNPFYGMGIGNARFNASAPLDYAIPAMSYLQPNPYVEEDPQATGVKSWTQMLQKYNVPLGPLTLAMSDFLDNGKMDNYYGDVLNSMAPIPGIGAPVSSIYQRATGNMPAKNGVMASLGFGPDTADDGFGLDPYRARRVLEWIAQEEGISQERLGYANQVILNQFNGDPIGQDIPPDQLEAAQALAQRGIKRAADDRIAGRAAAYETTMSVSPYTQAEQEAKAVKGAYNASGYSEENPLGSHELQSDIAATDPDYGRSFAKGSETPGLDGRISQLYNEVNRLKAANPQAYKGVIAGLYKEIDRLKVVQGRVDEDPYSGMNPEEKAAKIQDDAASQYWDEYFALPDSDAKAEYLRENPDFVPIYDANEVKKGREVKHWWEEGGDSSSSSTGSGASTIPTADNGRTPVADSEAPTYKDVKEDADYYFKNFLLSDNRDFDAEMAWLVEHPDVAEYEWRRYEKKNGKLPWWYEQYYGEEGAGNGKGAPRQPVYNPLPGNKLGEGYTVSDSYYNQSSTGSGAAGIGRRGGGGGGSDAYGQNWDEYKAFGDDYDAKRKYMLEHPEFADYYVKRYGKDSAWWLESYGGGGSGGRGKGGGGGPNPYAQNWDDYAAFGDDYDAKKQYMLEHPEFAKYYIERYGEDSAWWLRESGGGGGSSGGARTYTYYGGGGGGGYGGGGGGGSPSHYHGLAVNPAYMNRDLWQGPQQAQRNWIPYSDPQPEWLRAGQQIAPEPIRKWQPPRWNG